MLNLNNLNVGEDSGEVLSDVPAKGRATDGDDEERGEVVAARLLGLDHGHQDGRRRGQQRDAIPLYHAQCGTEVELSKRSMSTAVSPMDTERRTIMNPKTWNRGSGSSVTAGGGGSSPRVGGGTAF